MRFFAVLIALVVSAFLRASVLEVGPIYINGSGSLQSPDGFNDGPESLQMSFSASGSNGTDSVSTHGLALVTPLPPPLAGGIAFSGGQCGGTGAEEGAGLLCFATIDGISGLGMFANLGGGIGTVQVYEELIEPYPNFGPLLAEAQVITYGGVTSFGFTHPGVNESYSATFVLVSPSASPEPSTWGMGLIGIAGLAILRWRKRNAGGTACTTQA